MAVAFKTELSKYRDDPTHILRQSFMPHVKYRITHDNKNSHLMPWTVEVPGGKSGKNALRVSSLWTKADAAFARDQAILAAKNKQNRNTNETVLAGLNLFFATKEGDDIDLAKYEAAREAEMELKDCVMIPGADLKAIESGRDMGVPDENANWSLDSVNMTTANAADIIRKSQCDVFSKATKKAFDNAIEKGSSIVDSLLSHANALDQAEDRTHSKHLLNQLVVQPHIESILHAVEDSTPFNSNWTELDVANDDPVEQFLKTFIDTGNVDAIDKYHETTARVVIQLSLILTEARIFLGLMDGTIAAVTRDNGHTALWARLPQWLLCFICKGQMINHDLDRLTLHRIAEDVAYVVDLTNGDIVKLQEGRKPYLLKPCKIKNLADREHLCVNIVTEGDKNRKGLSIHHAITHALDPHSTHFELAQRFATFRGYVKRSHDKLWFERPEANCELDPSRSTGKACKTDIDHLLGNMLNCLWALMRCHHAVNQQLHQIRERIEKWLHPWIDLEYATEQCDRKFPVEFVSVPAFSHSLVCEWYD